MKLAIISLSLAFAGLGLADRSAEFNVATSGDLCGKGTTIYCSGAPCKGNFSPAQYSIVNLKVSGNCHISLYPKSNQQGGVSQRLNTDTTGTCITGGPWLSYGYFCD